MQTCKDWPCELLHERAPVYRSLRKFIASRPSVLLGLSRSGTGFAGRPCVLPAGLRYAFHRFAVTLATYTHGHDSGSDPVDRRIARHLLQVAAVSAA
jgi:hypothetical protein